MLAGYDRAFNDELERAIQRCAGNRPLQQSLESMRGMRWSSYILGSLLRSCPRTASVPDSLNFIAWRMLSPIGERGEPRKALFDLDPQRDYDLSIGNPLLARFRTFLMHDIRSICGGKIRRLLLSPRRPPTLSIMPTRRKAEKKASTVSAEEIPDRPQSGEQELYDDLLDLLKRQSTPEWPLADLFMAILNGMPLKDQRRRFGHTRTDNMRQTLKTLFRDYGIRTSNDRLVALMDKYQDFKANRPDPDRKPRPKAMPKPDVPDEVRDFRSIIDVIQGAGGSASMAVLASKRSRWLSRKPRDPASVHRTACTTYLLRCWTRGAVSMASDTNWGHATKSIWTWKQQPDNGLSRAMPMPSCLAAGGAVMFSIWPPSSLHQVLRRCHADSQRSMLKCSVATG